MKGSNNSIGKWISMLHRYAHSYLAKELKPYNIGSGQHIFLMALFRRDGISQEELSDNLNIDKGTTARAIKKLEQEGYVIRNVDPLDKRAYRVYITQRALEIKPEIFRILSVWTDGLVAHFSEEDKEKVLILLQEMAQNAAEFVKEDE